MELTRTANAGVLLSLDGISILLDGVCDRVEPYLATPQPIRRALLQAPPQALAFTHTHSDHWQLSFAQEYVKLTAGPVLGPAEIPGSSAEAVRLGSLTVTPIPTRHLGKGEQGSHYSYWIQGSRSILFTGDAAPEQWLTGQSLPSPDVLIAPFAYAIGRGWQVTRTLAPKQVVLLHLPSRQEDPYGLWESVLETVGHQPAIPILIPEMGQTLTGI